MAHIDIVFDSPPGHDGPRFVEVENEKGESIKIGEWIQRDNIPGNHWALRIPIHSLVQPHDIFKTGDDDIPQFVQDRNGEVVLQLCRRCGKGEAELAGPCELRRVVCQICNGSGFATPGTSYGDVCPCCGGTKEVSIQHEFAEICGCALTGSVHIIWNGQACELCNTPRSQFNPEEVEKAFNFYRQRIDEMNKKKMLAASAIRALKEALE